MAVSWTFLKRLIANVGPEPKHPDWPDSAGARERGKFRPSVTRTQTVVAVSDDEGQPVGGSTVALLEEMVYEMKLLRHALVLGGLAADIDEPLK